MKNGIFIWLRNHSSSILQNGERSFLNCWNSISRHSLSLYPKCRFILMQCAIVHLCANIRDLKLMIDKMQCPYILDLPTARLRNSFLKKNCNFLPKEYISHHWSSRAINFEAENSKIRVMLRDQREDQLSKNCNFFDFWSYSARLLRSVGSVIRCEANKSHRQRKKWPIGSLAVKMLRDLLCSACGLALRLAAAMARAKDWQRVSTTGQYDIKKCRAQQDLW